jgi:hypothetical protein
MPTQIEPGLLEGLAARSLQQIRIEGFAAAAGQRHLPRPGISLALCSLDQQEFGIAGSVRSEHDSDRRLNGIRLHDPSWTMSSKELCNGSQ